MSEAVIPFLVWLGLPLAVLATYRLLARITAQGGTSDQDATHIANQVLSQAKAFRGSRSADDPPWDGHNRLAKPTLDSGGLD
ncbi:MAG: hypothetical protein ACRDWS_09710 [Acidimicrobiia bacterium]